MISARNNMVVTAEVVAAMAKGREARVVVAVPIHKDVEGDKAMAMVVPND